MGQVSRRAVIGAVGTGGIAALAGCLDARIGDALFGGRGGPDPTAFEDVEGPPTEDRGLPADYTTAELRRAARSGGPGPDGIPSIDQPDFRPADNPPASVGSTTPVFGVRLNGDVRAYPQNVLVWHEIVNDTTGGERVAVTYCPLTGTAQGFYRGRVTFGVSGQLINTNLVMFDRTTGSWWPQILAWGIRGPHEGDYLREFQVVWTTWGRWRTRYPDTLILSEETGFARNYSRDPYGSYTPPSGYYTNTRTMFPTLAWEDRFHPKEVVIGARTRNGAMYVQKARLRDRGLIEGTMSGVAYATVYDQGLDTGWVYRNPDEQTIAYDDGRVTVDGEAYAPDDLPLERVVGFDAMWLAWIGYYPSTTIHE